jgi:hypothetical protein
MPRLVRHDGQMATEPELATHWDDAYAQGDTTRSWFQAAPEMSLRMLDAAGVTASHSVIDVGGGASPPGHDRAVFHFLTAEPDRRDYRRALSAGTARGSVAVIGCFAPDGPPMCSGLLVARYSPGELAAELARDWALIAGDREEHITPAGLVQPFTWAAPRRTR